MKPHDIDDDDSPFCLWCGEAETAEVRVHPAVSRARWFYCHECYRTFPLRRTPPEPPSNHIDSFLVH